MISDSLFPDCHTTHWFLLLSPPRTVSFASLLPSVSRFLGRAFVLASTAADVKKDTTACRRSQTSSVRPFCLNYTWVDVERYLYGNKISKCFSGIPSLALMWDSVLVKQWMMMVPVVARGVTLWFLCVCPAGRAVSSVRMAPHVGFRRTGSWEQCC